MKKRKLLLGGLSIVGALSLPLVAASCNDKENGGNIEEAEATAQIKSGINKKEKLASEIKKEDIELSVSIEGATAEIVGELKADDEAGKINFDYVIKKDGEESAKKPGALFGFKKTTSTVTPTPGPVNPTPGPSTPSKYDFIAENDYGSYKVTIKRIKDLERTGEAMHKGTPTGIMYTASNNLSDEEMKMVKFEPEVPMFLKDDFNTKFGTQMFYDFKDGGRLIGKQTGNKPWEGIHIFTPSIPNQLQITDAINDTYSSNKGWQSSGFINLTIENEKKLTFLFRTYNHGAKWLSEEVYEATIEIK